MKHRLRADKTCLNCRRVVPERYCTHCGQENVQPRKSFHYLFTHFVEDLVHYDSSFYKTVKSLLFAPGRLTIEYLNGKRKTYVPPVKLYIFISFLCFFLLSFIVSRDEDRPEVKVQDKNTVNDTSKIKYRPFAFQFADHESVEQLDSAQAVKPESQRLTKLEYEFERKLIVIRDKYPPQVLSKIYGDIVMRSIPKALFLYLPVFALVLWLFHSRKRWFYYDHGIFTLHYFSFLLLTFSIILLLTKLMTTISEQLGAVVLFGWIALWMYWIFYFFRAHRRVYMESKTTSRLKSLAMFVINSTLLVFFIVGVMLYSALILD